MKFRYSLLSFIIPRVNEIIFISIFLATVGLGPRLLNVDGDLGRHLTVGKYILSERKIPTKDVFSHTMFGKSLTPHEWLAQVCFAMAEILGGLNGVVVLCALLLGLSYAICFHQCYLRSGLYTVSFFFVVLGAAAGSLHWLARPHLFTLLFATIWTEKLDQILARRNNQKWSFPLLMLLWANLHGAFLIGFVILGLYIISRVIDIIKMPPAKKPNHPCKDQILREYFLIGILSFLASLLNPSGWRLWATTMGFLQNRYLVGHTAEYLPPDFHNPSTFPFLFLIFLSLLVFGFVGKGFSSKDVILLASWTAMGLYSVRNVPIYALIAAPILSSGIGEIINEIAHSHYQSRIKTMWSRLAKIEKTLRKVEEEIIGYVPSIAVVSAVILLYSLGFKLDLDRLGNRFDSRVFPVEAVDWLESNQIKGNMFNEFTWGGYLLYRLYPNQKVFIDGQTDFYGEMLTRQYETIVTLSNGWENLLSWHQIEWVIFPSNTPLVKELLRRPEWRLVYQDQTSSVFLLEP